MNSMLRRSTVRALAVILTVAFVPDVYGTTFTNLSDYNVAVGAHSVITFEGLEAGEILANQYAGLGATFTDGDDTVILIPNFETDGIGIIDNGSTSITFNSPMNHFGVEFPGAVTIELYDGANLLSSDSFGGSGQGFFGGVLNPGQTYDRVVLLDEFVPPGYYDNLHFGLTVPEPSALGLAAFGVLGVALQRPKRC